MNVTGFRSGFAHVLTLSKPGYADAWVYPGRSASASPSFISPAGATARETTFERARLVDVPLHVNA